MSGRKMRDVPMLDYDREKLREEFEGFDDMTLPEFSAAVQERTQELADLIERLQDPPSGG